jgi:hypothetical protein
MKGAMREEFRVEGLAEPISHYTDAVRYAHWRTRTCDPRDES